MLFILYITLIFSRASEFLKTVCYSRKPHSSPCHNQIPYTGVGEKAGNTDRCQRFKGRGQRLRVGDLGIQQTRLPFPPPPAQWE